MTNIINIKYEINSFANHAELLRLQRSVETVENPFAGAKEYNAVVRLRHDLFGESICDKLGVKYRNDVPLEELVTDVNNTFGLNLTLDHPKLTPDNYIIRQHEREVIIVDYKTSSSPERLNQAMQKYINLVNSLNKEVQRMGTDKQIVFKFAILHLNPYSQQVYVSDSELLTDIGVDVVDLGFLRDLEVLFNTLDGKFQHDPDYISNKTFDTFIPTESWVTKDFEKDCRNDPTFTEFYESLPDKTKEHFEKGMGMTFEGDRNANYNQLYSQIWKDNFQDVRSFQNEIIEDFMKPERITSCSEPTESSVTEGWEMLETRLNETCELKNTCNDAAPSTHMLWSPDLEIEETNFTNFKKFKHFGKILNSIDWKSCTDWRGESAPDDPVVPFIRQLSKLMNVDIGEGMYNTWLEKLKDTPFKQRERLSSGETTFVNDMQISFKPFKGRAQFLQHAGVNISKKQGFRSDSEPYIDRPQILDPFDRDLAEQAKTIVMGDPNWLNEPSGMQPQKTILDFYLRKVKEAAGDSGRYEYIQDVMNTNYYKAIVDMATLMRGALATALSSTYTAFRIIYCASSSTFLILLPSKSLRVAGSSVCFMTITIHKKDSVRHYTGCERLSFDTVDGYKVIVSTVIRFDKERCKRLVESPHLFLLLYSNFFTKNYQELDHVRRFCFYFAGSTSKSLMTLAEPTRYIIMGTSAAASNVKKFIGEKFDPKPKSLFSLWFFSKVFNASYRANTDLKGLCLKECFAAEEDIQIKGVEDDPVLQSIFFKGKVSLKEYLKEVYTPFYLNSKGLHYYHHNIMALSKVPLEIERKTKKTMKEFWEKTPQQYVNLPIFMAYIGNYYGKSLGASTRIRRMAEDQEHFIDPIYTIPTMTSSKSCVEVGDFATFKTGVKSANVKKRPGRLVRNQNSTFEHWKSTFVGKTDKDEESIQLKNSDIFLWIELPEDSQEQVWRETFVRKPKELKGTATILYSKESDKIAYVRERQIFEVGLRNAISNALRVSSGLRHVYVSSAWEIEKVLLALWESYGKTSMTFTVMNSSETDIHSIPSLGSDEDSGLLTHHTYDTIKNEIPEYVDFTTMKVYDRVFSKSASFNDKSLFTIAEETLDSTDQLHATLFQKGQRTGVDREIYEMEIEGKIMLYTVEHLFKQWSKLEPNEMISQPGDLKVNSIERSRSELFKFALRHRKTDEKDWDVQLTEINADMTKWSAMDVTAKYYLMIALNPCLHPKEKWYYCKFLSLYQRKRLLIPDAVMRKLLDQKEPRENDVFREMTNGFQRNWVEISQNWLMGNLNYLSSLTHVMAMNLMRDCYFALSRKLKGNVWVNSLVHSDDNQSCIGLAVPKGSQDMSHLDKHGFQTLEKVMNLFGFGLNTKKTHCQSVIKEFVSQLNLNGEPYSIYNRFLFPVVGDCSYLGPYEDLTAQLSGIQAAIRQGCPPSEAWLAIGIATEMTYATYSMLPGMLNDPLKVFPVARNNLPLELGGIPDFDLAGFLLIGAEAHDIKKIATILGKSIHYTGGRTFIEDLVNATLSKDLLNAEDRWMVNYYVTFTITDKFDADRGFAETYEMRSKSKITPRKFTTQKLITKLRSARTFKELTSDDQQELLEYMLRNKQLLVSKADTMEQFQKSILYRYFSRRFVESVSLQSAVQLYVEQVINAGRACIDREFDKLCSSEEVVTDDANLLRGKLTYQQAFSRVDLLVNSHHFDVGELSLLCKHRLLSDGTAAIVANMSSSVTYIEPMKSRTTFSIKCHELQVMKNVINSPFKILKAFLRWHESDELPSETDTLFNDVMVAREFMDASGLLEYAKSYEPVSEKLFSQTKERIAAWSVALQSLYIYLSQSARQHMVVFVPNRVRGVNEYVLTLYGMLHRDNYQYSLTIQGNPVPAVQKAHVELVATKESMESLRFFRALGTFAIRYIKPAQIKFFYEQLMDCCKYNNKSIRSMYEVLLKKHRHEFLPLLHVMGDATEADYKGIKTHHQIQQTWFKEQKVRGSDLGDYQVSYWNASTTLSLAGDGRKITACKIEAPDLATLQVGDHLRKISMDLNAATLTPCEILDKAPYHIVKEQGRYNRIQLGLSLTKDIEDKVPVCPVFIQKGIGNAVSITRIKELNPDNMANPRYLRISDSAAVTTKRAPLSHLKGVEGEIESSGRINIIGLIKNIGKINVGFAGLNLFTLAELFQCYGDEESDFIDDGYVFEMFAEEEVSVNLDMVFLSAKRTDTPVRKHITKTLLQTAANRDEYLTKKWREGAIAVLMKLAINKYLCDYFFQNPKKEWELAWKVMHLLLYQTEFHEMRDALEFSDKVPPLTIHNLALPDKIISEGRLISSQVRTFLRYSEISGPIQQVIEAVDEQSLELFNKYEKKDEKLPDWATMEEEFEFQ